MRIFSFFAALFLLVSSEVLAADQDYNIPSNGQSSVRNFSSKPVREGFFFNPFLSLEYSAPHISGGVNSDFKTNAFEEQIKDFQNIAIGFNFRVHRFLGFNANWAQADLYNEALSGTGISQKASYKIKQTNFSILAYAPKVIYNNGFVDSLEFFAEAGVAMMRNKLTFTDSTGTAFNEKKDKNAGFYGAGFQITPFKSKNAIRFSVQRYTGKLPMLEHSHYTTVRIGYLMNF